MVRVLIIAAALLASGSSYQAQPADALRTCVTDNSTGKDRKELAKWIFLSMAAHPDMKQHATPNASAAADESARAIAALLTRLITESCVKETRAVMQAGQLRQSMEVAFERLGQLAMQELMADKAVAESMGLFERYVDQKRMSEVFAGKH